MDGNLVSFNTNGIEIYSKEKNKYKSISQTNIEGIAMNDYEVEKNKLIIFKKIFEMDKNSSEDDLSTSEIRVLTAVSLSFFDLVNKEEKILISPKLREDSEHEYDFEISNFLKNDKYLFVNFRITYSYHEHYEPDPNYKYGNLNREVYYWKKKYRNVGYVYNLSKEKFLECELVTPDISDRIAILCDYNNDLFIAKKGKVTEYSNCYEDEDSKPLGDENQLNLFKYEDETFKSYRKLPFEIDDRETIIKLKNNNFIIYSSNDIKLLKSN